jgi:hypothetical protein
MSTLEDINTYYTRELIYAIYDKDEIKINNLLELNFILNDQKEIFKTLKQQILKSLESDQSLKDQKSLINNIIIDSRFVIKYYESSESYKYDHVHLYYERRHKDNSRHWLFFEDMSIIFFAFYSKYLISSEKKDLTTETLLKIILKFSNLYYDNTFICFSNKEDVYLNRDVQVYFNDSYCTYYTSSFVNIQKDTVKLPGQYYSSTYLKFNGDFEILLNKYIKQKYLEVSYLNRDVDTIILKYAGF